MNQLTPTSQEGDQSNALKGQPWQSLQHANPINDGSPANSDECFKCHKLGHCAIHCPSVDVGPQCNAVQGGDPGAYSIPEKHCPCCGRACLIFTSHTRANPGKKFYRCHGREVHLLKPYSKNLIYSYHILVLGIKSLTVTI